MSEKNHYWVVRIASKHQPHHWLIEFGYVKRPTATFTFAELLDLQDKLGYLMTMPMYVGYMSEEKFDSKYGSRACYIML